MTITINLDFASIVSEAVQPERIKPLVENAIRDAINAAIQHATSYKSRFQEELIAQLSEALPHGLAIDDMSKFQHVLNAAINEAVHGQNAKTVQTALAVAAKKVMPDVPTRIKLSELIAAARAGLHVNEGEEFYAELEMNEYGGRLFLDDDACKRERKWGSDIILAFTKEGEVFSLRLDGRDITSAGDLFLGDADPKSIPDACGRFDGLLLSMYVGRTSIEIDGDADDVETWAEPKDGEP
jgi:hypothetical protein